MEEIKFITQTYKSCDIFDFLIVHLGTILNHILHVKYFEAHAYGLTPESGYEKDRKE